MEAGSSRARSIHWRLNSRALYEMPGVHLPKAVPQILLVPGGERVTIGGHFRRPSRQRRSIAVDPSAIGTCHLLGDLLGQEPVVKE